MTNTITKAGRHWAVIDDATGKVHCYLNTRREAENWKARWEAAAAEEAEYQAERRAARLAIINDYLARRAERRDAQLTLAL